MKKNYVKGILKVLLTTVVCCGATTALAVSEVNVEQAGTLSTLLPARDSELKVTDIAAALGSNRRFISDCINSQRGCSFTQFINGYRIDHAKRILRQDPNKKIADVYMEAGFANEQSFFRTFKAITGMTPSEWKAQ